MARYKLNIKSLEVPDVMKQRFLAAIGELFRSHGMAPECDGELLVPLNGNDEAQWVKDLKSSPEAIELDKSIKEVNDEIKDTLCPHCGFVAKHAGALGGHIRFKHKR